MTFQEDYSLWRAYCDLKIKKIEKSLERPSSSHDSYVFSLFRNHVRLFLTWLTSNLGTPPSLPGLTPAERNLDERRRSRNALEALDELALYMRFYESAQFADVPFPLIEHVQSIFATLENRAAILLRPQNDQEFETRGELHDIQARLRYLTGLAGPPTWNPDNLTDEISALPNIFVISYPKYFGDTFLFFPLFGHELAHVVYRTRGLEVQITEPQTLELIKGPTASARAQRKLASKWALELFCDLVGFHLYGEPYVYALWMFLYKYGETFAAEPVAEDLLTQSPPDLQSLQEKVVRLVSEAEGDRPAQALTVADGVKRLFMDVVAAGLRPDKTRVLFSHYPSPATRIRELVRRCDPGAEVSSTKTFNDWRLALIKGYRDHEDAFGDHLYRDALHVAIQISNELFANIAATLPARPGAATHIAATDQLADLLRRWIPPCETTDSNGSLEPASWGTILLAAWVQFLEAAGSSDPELRGSDWPLEWMDFVYQAFDMNMLYSTFRDVKRALDRSEAPSDH